MSETVEEANNIILKLEIVNILSFSSLRLSGEAAQRNRNTILTRGASKLHK